MVRKLPQTGFALIELLLVVILLLLFTSAAVMNLTPFWRGARLEEGVGQLESLLRFARAEAAQQGRRLLLQVQAPAGIESLGASPASRTAIHVRWEPEPLDQPGVFVESRTTAALAQSVADHVRIEHVRRLEPAAPPSPTASPQAPATIAGSQEPLASPGLEEPSNWPPIMFYPDGSSDSAEILVGSADVSDSRRLLVRWNGLSGDAAREALDPEGLAAFGGTTAEAQPLEPASVARTTLVPPAP